MTRPDDYEGRAFLLPEPFEDPDEPAVVVLADELAAAAESRRGWELPVDHASRLQAVRDVRIGGRMHGGVYWTAAEERDDAAVHDLPEHVGAALAPFTPRLAGTRWRWEGTKRIYEVGVVGDPTPLREAVSGVRFAGRVRVVCRTVSEEALEALGEAVWAASDELEALDIVLQGGGGDPEAGAYELMVVGPDEARGRAVLQSRFGERLRVDWIAAGTSESQPRAFATWTAEDRSLTVHSWHDHNGRTARLLHGRAVHRSCRGRALGSGSDRIHHADRRLATDPRDDRARRTARVAGRCRPHRRRPTPVVGRAARSRSATGSR
jgi:hypothetical protein